MTDPDPIEGAPNRGRDVVTRFRDEYADALIAARISATHTATTGWQVLYASHFEDLRLARRMTAVALRELAESLEDVGLSDDESKELLEARKTIQLLNDRDRHFRQRVVDPVAKPVLDCAKLADRYLAEARREEAQAPLHQSGLEELMRQAIADQPPVSFDNETGVVKVADDR